AHKPEVCYPAQGFALKSNEPTELSTPFGTIAARRLDTSLGARKEPVTYWFTMGDTPIESRFQKRLVELRLNLTGQVPDGLLFRISSIDGSTTRAFQAQDAFVADLLKAVPQKDRTRLSGLGAPVSANGA
ncbi:MAG: EpsI family protein, partial [Ramlibacter sp.]|nr:EpsI family protein [Ramlibacter sp.]